MNRSTTFHSEKEREQLVSSLESLERMNHELRLSLESLNGYKQRLEDELKENKKDFEDLEKDFEVFFRNLLGFLIIFFFIFLMIKMGFEAFFTNFC